MSRICVRFPWLCAPLALLAPAAALAAEPGQQGPSQLLFVGQLAVLLLWGRVIGELMLRLKQPAVMGQLIAGVLLGPSLFGWLLPDLQHALFPDRPEQKAMLDAISQVGILLLLLLTGMETDLKLVRQSGRAALFASLAGILVPFACGVAMGEFLPDSMLPDPHKRLVTALFLGIALSIGSVQIVALVVREMNFMRRTVGQVIIASSIIGDSIGWIVISMIFSLAAHGAVEPWSLARSAIGTLAFLIVSLTVGRRAVFFAIRWVNDTFLSDFAVVTAILLIMSAMALITAAIGVHTVLGAFVAGVLVGESPILTKHIDEQLRGLITAFFAPIFFGLAGLSADLTILGNAQIAIITAILIAIASIGKFSGGFVGGALGGLSTRENLALGLGMNARGSTEVIIASIGLAMGALSQDLFTMIVAMAVLTTLAMPPTLRWALARIPMHKAERQRLEREEMETKGFLPKVERLLLAVDDSGNGKFAARIAGMIAGPGGLPTTVMHIDTTGKRSKTAAEVAQEKAAEASETVKEFASQAGKIEEQRAPDEKKSASAIDITTKVEKPKADAIAAEAEKGYDLLIIGLDKTVAGKTQFHGDVTKLALGFKGALAVVEARGRHRERPLPSKLSILVPVNGTEASRRGAEVAVMLARVSQAPLTVLYVTPADANKRSRQYEEAILKDIVALAETYNVNARSAVRADEAAEAAILKEMAARRHNITVIGVGRRPGDKLFFGDTAAGLLEKSEYSLLFVAS